jgi:hypothetical protein
MPGKDRDRDRRRREELDRRRLWPGLTGQEKAELSMLNALFLDEDRASSLRGGLRFKQVMAEIGRGEPLTESEKQEVAEHDRRYPPKESPFKDAMKAIRAVVEKERERRDRTRRTERSSPAD